MMRVFSSSKKTVCPVWRVSTECWEIFLLEINHFSSLFLEEMCLIGVAAGSWTRSSAILTPEPVLQPASFILIIASRKCHILVHQARKRETISREIIFNKECNPVGYSGSGVCVCIYAHSCKTNNLLTLLLLSLSKHQLYLLSPVLDTGVLRLLIKLWNV